MKSGVHDIFAPSLPRRSGRHSRFNCGIELMRGAFAMIAVLAGTIGVCHAAPPRYRAVDIGFLDGTSVTQIGKLNDVGQVVAQGVEGDRVFSFVWEAGKGRIAIKTPDEFVQVHGLGINNSGTVVGLSYFQAKAGEDFETHPFVWDPKAGFRSVLIEGGRKYNYFDISQITDDDEIVGSYLSSDGGGVTKPFIASEAKGLGPIWSPSWMFTTASKLNRHGQLAGTVVRRGCDARAIVYDRSTRRKVSLGTLADPHPPPCASSTTAASINDLGEVVGTDIIPSLTTSAYIWSRERGMRELIGPATSIGSAFSAWDINNASQVVGTFVPQSGALSRKYFYWDAESGAVALDDLLDRGDPATAKVVIGAGSLEYPDINNAGQILVAGYTTDDAWAGLWRAFLLTPVR